MPLFRCTKCGCVENTALSNFWVAQRDDEPLLCSGCDPEKKVWHGQFPQQQPSDLGYVEHSDGFLYHPVREAGWIKRMGLRPRKARS